MMEHISISEFIFNSRFVFVIAAGRIPQGERDYSEHTLATPTLQRSHCLRGVVNMVLVRVKVDGAKSMFL